MSRTVMFLAASVISCPVFALDPLQRPNLPYEFSESNSEDPRFTVTDRVWPASVGEADVCLWPDDKMAAVSFTLDDGDAANIDWWLDQMESRGWRMSWFMITDYANRGFSIDAYGSWDDYRYIHGRGHEVSSHTFTHGYCSSPAAPYSCPIDTTLDTSRTTCCTADKEYFQSQKDIRDSIPGNQCLTLAYSGHDPYQAWEHGGGTTWFYSYEHDPSIAASYYIAARGTTGRPNKVNRTSYMNTYCGTMDDTAWIDYLIDRTDDELQFWRGWNVALWHGIEDTVVHKKYFDYIKQREADLWVARYVDAAKYGQERDTKKLTVTGVTLEHLTFAVTDSMNDAVFDYPLTVKVRIDNAWESVAAIQNGQPVAVTIVEHYGDKYALVKAVPDRGEVVLARASLPAVTIAADQALTESTLGGRSITVTVSNDRFADNQIASASIMLTDAPAGCTVSGVTWIDDTHCTVLLAFDGTDFDADITTFGLTVAEAELERTIATASSNRL
ncbi:MAG: polysaccharide deacetylase family protein, partial [Chitinispirillaceae bacterium]|nr:polysaccharide deacetylase family protein [Chitinispirillaceae bacterium]